MAFKMKGHTLPGINQRMDKSSLKDGRAKSSAFQKDEKVVEGGTTPTEAELMAKADAQFGEGVGVSGGKKTKQGSFIQDERGSSVAGSSIEHADLRKKKKGGKLTSAERVRLRDLELTTEKAYKKLQSTKPGQS